MTRLPFLNTARCATRAVVAVAGIVSRADWMTQTTASRTLHPSSRLISRQTHSLICPRPPVTRRQAENAYAAILDLQTAFQERLFALKAVGHNGSIELAESDLVAIGVVLRNLATVLDGFEK